MGTGMTTRTTRKGAKGKKEFRVVAEEEEERRETKKIATLESVAFFSAPFSFLAPQLGWHSDIPSLFRRTAALRHQSPSFVFVLLSSFLRLSPCPCPCPFAVPSCRARRLVIFTLQTPDSRLQSRLGIRFDASTLRRDGHCTRMEKRKASLGRPMDERVPARPAVASYSRIVHSVGAVTHSLRIYNRTRTYKYRLYVGVIM